MIDNDNIEKGNYTHPVADGYVTPKHYIFTEKNGKRCLLLRFVNDSAHTVSAFEFVLTELSADGKVIGHSRITHSGISIASGGTFAPDRGIVVHAECADFRIRLVSFVSGVYKFVLKRGRAAAHYDPRGYRVPKTKPNIYDRAEVKPVLSAGKRVFTLIAVLAVILITVSSISAKYRSGNSLPESDETYGSYEQI